MMGCIGQTRIKQPERQYGDFSKNLFAGETNACKVYTIDSTDEKHLSRTRATTRGSKFGRSML